MTTNTRAYPRRTNTQTFWIAFVTSSFMLTMLAAAALVVAPYAGFGYRPAPPTMRPPSWALANIAKPTYTPSPMPTFTPTAQPTPTNIPTSTQSPLELGTVPDAGSNGSDSYTGGKSILVSISEQHLYAYDNGQLIYSFVASTGMRNSTRVGSFSILDKIPNAYGATWDIWMPDWMGIYYSGTLENGIHALPILPSGDILWSGYLGTPISFGCVVLGTDTAEQLYNWADIGTPVEIRW